MTHPWDGEPFARPLDYPAPLSVDDALDEICPWREDADPLAPHIGAARSERPWLPCDTERALCRGVIRLQKRKTRKASKARRQQRAAPRLIRVTLPHCRTAEERRLMAFFALLDDDLPGRLAIFFGPRRPLYFECDACGARGAWWFLCGEDACPGCGHDVPDAPAMRAPERPWPLWTGAAMRALQWINAQRATPDESPPELVDLPRERSNQNA